MITRRITVLRLFIAAVFVVLACRLWTLQVAQWSGHYGRVAVQNRWHTEYVEAPRGIVYDRNGIELAQDQPVYNLTVVPAELPQERDEYGRMVAEVAAALDKSTVEIGAALREIRGPQQPRQHVLSGGEDISRDTAIRLDEIMWRTPGIHVTESFKRYYPHGKLAAHLIGYASVIGPEPYQDLKDVCWETLRSDTIYQVDNVDILAPAKGEPVYSVDSTFGRSGVERMCEYVEPMPGRFFPVLQGRRGMLRTQVDITGQPAQKHPDVVEPIPGASVVLALNARWQAVAERTLKAQIEADPANRMGGAAVLLDVSNGEVLVMASYPAVDPNRYVKGFPDQEYQVIRRDPRKPEWNRAIAGEYPVGSVMKMISACAALESTGMTERTSFDCEGVIRVGRHNQPFRCHRRSGHGPVGLYEALSQSCDVYFWRCVTDRGLTAADLAACARDFGLGALTGCGLPSERKGRIPTERWKSETWHEPWWQGDTLNFVIGQGYMEATPLQIAVATAAVANGGQVRQPKIVRRYLWPPGASGPEVSEPQRRPPVNIKPETLAKVRAGMRRAVTSPRGTAHAAFAGFPIPVAGKTGSAETWRHKLAHAWFACFAPYDQPQYACVVIIEHGRHGSEAAAPVARAILAAAFGVSGPSPAPPAGGPAE